MADRSLEQLLAEISELNGREQCGEHVKNLSETERRKLREYWSKIYPHTTWVWSLLEYLL